jgi:H+/gluconate symporter-like permease
MRPALLLALAAVGAAISAAPATARIVQPDPPPPPIVERGGRAVPSANRAAATSCAIPSAFDIAAVFAFEACFGMSHAEALARITAANRLLLEQDTAAFRAPRLAAKARRAAALERRRLPR